MISQRSVVLYATLVIWIGQVHGVTYFCNFDVDQCDQWNSTSSTNQWVRVSRRYRDSSRRYYDYGYEKTETVMESTVSKNESARLESLQLDPGRVNLTFETMSLSNTRGRLKVYRKWNEHMDELESITPEYKKRTTIKKSFDCQVPCKVVFQSSGVRGWQSRILHIDDVKIDFIPYPYTTPAPVTVQPHQHRNRLARPPIGELHYCNFDKNNCSHLWFSDNSDDFDWIHRTGSSLINGTGPTSGYKGEGYYMVMEARGHKSGEKARLLSGEIHPGFVTLTFRYSMFGDDVGRLRVYKKVESKMTVVWIKVGPQDTRSWLLANLTFQCNSVCRVVFEAERGVFEHGDIAIDELLLSVTHDHALARNRTGVLRDVCDFEKDFCNWSQTRRNALLWERWRGLTPTTNTGPLGDYTTGGGVYALFRDSTDRTNLTASMTSHVIRYPFWRELRFAYHKLQYNNQTSRLNVYKKLEATGVTELIWTSPQVEGELDWQWTTVIVHSNASYFLIFEAVGGCCGYGDIAVDDVEITSGVLPEISDCDFNGSLCKWSQSTDDDFDWVLNVGDNSTKSTPMTGPPINDGPYAYTDASYPRVNGDVAVLDGPAIGPLGNSSICIRFLYYMYGTHVGKQQLTRSKVGGSEKDDRLLWTRSGNQGQRWWSGYVTLPFVNDDVFRLRFKSERRYGIRGNVAIKNVITDTKPCHEDAPYDCDFAVDMCEWRLSVSSGTNWTRATSGKDTEVAPLHDHTTGSKDGGFMILSSGKDQPSFFITVTTSKTLCVGFWYFSYGSDRNGRLAFWTQPQDGSMATIKWSFTAEVVTWQHAKVSVQSNISYKMGFQARAIDGFKAVDDIRVTAGPCA